MYALIDEKGDLKGLDPIECPAKRIPAGWAQIVVEVRGTVGRPWMLDGTTVVDDMGLWLSQERTRIRAAIVALKRTLLAHQSADDALGLDPSSETLDVESQIVALVAEYKEL
jgi:hypothetical protein